MSILNIAHIVFTTLKAFHTIYRKLYNHSMHYIKCTNYTMSKAITSIESAIVVNSKRLLQAFSNYKNIIYKHSFPR